MFTLHTLARECTERCTNQKCPIKNKLHCPLKVVDCFDVMEEDWICTLNKNERLLKYIDETVGKDLEEKYYIPTIKETY